MQHLGEVWERHLKNYDTDKADREFAVKIFKGVSGSNSWPPPSSKSQNL